MGDCMNKKGFVIESIVILVIVAIAAIVAIDIYQNVSFGVKTGIVVDKEYHSSWVSYNTSYSSNTHLSIPVTHPERWSIKIKKEDKELWIDVSENEYNNLSIGDCYNCKKE